MLRGIFVLTMIAGLFVGSEAQAASAYGKVTFVGTLSQLVSNGYHARFRVRLSNSTCTGDNVPKTRWLHFNSGRMDGAFAHNLGNTRNAYNTLMTAFLAKRNVQIDGVPSCSAGTKTLSLWGANVGMY